jgi:hypothetical protein
MDRLRTEEDCAEVCFGPLGGIWLEVGLDVDDEGGADRREQTGLGMRSTLCGDKGTQKRTKIKVVLRSSLCFAMYSVSYSVASRLYMV